MSFAIPTIFISSISIILFTFSILLKNVSPDYLFLKSIFGKGKFLLFLLSVPIKPGTINVGTICIHDNGRIVKSLFPIFSFQYYSKGFSFPFIPCDYPYQSYLLVTAVTWTFSSEYSLICFGIQKNRTDIKFSSFRYKHVMITFYWVLF